MPVHEFEVEIVRILRKPAVARYVGLGKSSIDQMWRRGEFPAPIRLSAQAIGWDIEDLDKWLAERTRVGATA